ncbi:MAG: hypothetical protein KDA92_04140 [Planctomycetales bacterium]|nr:hypothetical protein [Planctomycetales bacterium]MCA9171929.1 hypothetical protein [Planctomycetales bacterium]
MQVVAPRRNRYGAKIRLSGSHAPSDGQARTCLDAVDNPHGTLLRRRLLSWIGSLRRTGLARGILELLFRFSLGDAIFCRVAFDSATFRINQEFLASF